MEKPFPGSQIAPEEKLKPETGTKIGSAIYSTYSTRYSERIRRIYENRAYAINNQDTSQYKGFIDPEFNNLQQKKMLFKGSLVNISWRVWSPAKKFVGAVIGTFIDSRHSLQFTSIDKGSKGEKERKKNELIAGIYAKEQLKGIAEILGTGVEPTGEEAQLTSSEDVELYMGTTYKQMKEIGMEMLVSHVLQQNKFFEDIEPRVLHDLVENNRLASRCIFSSNKSILIKYVDIASYIGTETDHPTNEYNDYDAVAEYYTIAELREQICNKSTKDIEILLYEVAEKAMGKWGNPSEIQSFQYNNVHNEYPWNDWRVEAVFFEWHTIDQEYLRIKNKEGKTFLDKKVHVPENRTAEYIASDWAMVYEGIYIPCITKTLAYKRQENLVRPFTSKGSSTKVVRRFIYVEPNKRGGTSSALVDDIKANLNEIMVSILKIRQLIAESGPPGLAVDWDALSQVMLDGAQVSVVELIQVMRTKGVLFYSGKDENGAPQRVPITEMKSDFSQSLQTHLAYIQQQLGMIREATGINDAMDGTVNNSKALVGIQRMKAISAHRLLRELFNAYSQQYFKRLGETLRDMIQTQIKHGWREEEYRDVIGDACYEVLKMDPMKPYPLFGCHVVSVPTEDQLNQIQSQIDIGLRAGTVMPQDTIDIMSIGNVKKIMLTLQYRERKTREQQQEQMQMAAELEAQKIQMASEARIEAERQIADAKADAKIRELKAMYDYRLTEVVEKETQVGANELRKVHAIADRDDEQIKLQAALQVGGGPRPAPGVQPTAPAKSALQNSEKSK
jgi:hypothetical protein